MKDAALYEKLKANVIVDATGCWIWQRSRRTDGYGQFNFRGKPTSAHRVMWYAVHGEWFVRSQDALICHTCDVRLCCNPAHLWKGTAAQNNEDRDLKGRNAHANKTVCPRGHAYTEDNTKPQRGGHGRVCLKCRRINTAKYRERLRIRLGTKRRPPVITEPVKQEALRRVADGERFCDIAAALKISEAQLYRARKQAGLHFNGEAPR